jgi:hypothetical protein
MTKAGTFTWRDARNLKALGGNFRETRASSDTDFLATFPSIVMAGHRPGHPWIAGSSPAMTRKDMDTARRRHTNRHGQSADAVRAGKHAFTARPSPIAADHLRVAFLFLTQVLGMWY